MSALLKRLRGGLIVSVQARPGSALDDPGVLAAMARSAVDGGAAGVRIQGAANLAAVRRRVDAPIVGLVKRDYDGFEPYITPTLAEVAEILESGAEIVAFDATARARPGGVGLAEIVTAVHSGGALAMADCSTAADAANAHAAGADILATTLAGYTKETAGRPLPALDLLPEFRALGAFTICEGGIHAPQHGSDALAAGADAIVVGTAITDVGWVTARYAEPLRRG